jgi:hypothetical protein
LAAPSDWARVIGCGRGDGRYFDGIVLGAPAAREAEDRSIAPKRVKRKRPKPSDAPRVGSV